MDELFQVLERIFESSGFDASPAQTVKRRPRLRMILAKFFFTLAIDSLNSLDGFFRFDVLVQRVGDVGILQL